MGQVITRSRNHRPSGSSTSNNSGGSISSNSGGGTKATQNSGKGSVEARPDSAP